MDSDDVQVDSHNMTIYELIEMHEQEQDLKGLTEDLSSNEKGLRVLENIDSNEQRIFSTKQGIKKLVACFKATFRTKNNL